MTEPLRDTGQSQSVRAADETSAERHRLALRRYAGRIAKNAEDAEEIVQDVMLKAASSPPPTESPSLVGWLYAVTFRAAIDKVRERHRRTRLESAPARTASPGTPEEIATLRERREVLAAALHELKEPYRSALTLRYLEDFEFDAIARALGTIERTARTWVGRGLSQLRARLEEDA